MSHRDQLEAKNDIRSAEQRHNHRHHGRKGRDMNGEAVKAIKDDSGAKARHDIVEHADTKLGVGAILINFGYNKRGCQPDDGQQDNQIILHFKSFHENKRQNTTLYSIP